MPKNKKYITYDKEIDKIATNKSIDLIWKWKNNKLLSGDINNA